jgi:hypothetical protein
VLTEGAAWFCIDIVVPISLTMAALDGPVIFVANLLLLALLSERLLRSVVGFAHEKSFD